MKTEAEIRIYLDELRKQWEEFEHTFDDGDIEEGKLLGVIEGLEYVLNEGENQ